MTPDEYRKKNPDCKTCEYGKKFDGFSSVYCRVKEEYCNPKAAKRCKVYSPIRWDEERK